MHMYVYIDIHVACFSCITQKFQAISAAYTRLVASEETDDEISTVSSCWMDTHLLFGCKFSGNGTFSSYRKPWERCLLKSGKYITVSSCTCACTIHACIVVWGACYQCTLYMTNFYS